MATPRVCSDKLPAVGLPGTKHERTFIAVKPDGVHRGVVGEVIKRFEQRGFKLVGIKILAAPVELAKSHYAEHAKKKFFTSLVDYITSGPIVAMVWEGKGVVATSRKMLGETKPANSAAGTIRGDFGITMQRNVVHGSDKPESAQREIRLWFSPNELCDWVPNSHTWVYQSKL